MELLRLPANKIIFILAIGFRATRKELNEHRRKKKVRILKGFVNNNNVSISKRNMHSPFISSIAY